MTREGSACSAFPLWAGGAGGAPRPCSRVASSQAQQHSRGRLIGAYLDTSVIGWYQPAQVLNNKNCRRHRRWTGLVLAGCLLAGGCTPPGPRALLEGRRLMEQGRFADAIPRLQKAAEL